jgi:hypothetical protein
LTTRREFLSSSSAALVGMSSKAGRKVNGGFVFESEIRGHRLRDRAQ